MAYALDHIVINVLFDMDRAAEVMSKLGFTVTPRGYHSMGSINHLMMFEHDYLELIGLPPGGEKLRKDVLESPRGLNGLVFKADDADASLAQLRGAGLAMLEPFSFARPVTIDGVEQLARFRTVRVAPEVFEAGRIYYCHHYTPEFVWHRPWLTHANGCSGMSELVVVSNALEADVPLYAKAAQGEAQRQSDGGWAIELANGFRISLMPPARYHERYSEFAVEADGRNSYFGAIVINAPDVTRIKGLASSIADVRIGIKGNALTLSIPFLNTLLEFR